MCPGLGCYIDIGLFVFRERILLAGCNRSLRALALLNTGLDSLTGAGRIRPRVEDGTDGAPAFRQSLQIL